MKNPHVVVVEDSKKVFAVMVNPAAVTPFIQVGQSKMPEGTLLASTGSYHDHGTPIGFLWDGDEVFKSKRTEKDHLRSHLIFANDARMYLDWAETCDATDKCVMQIGPKLVQFGKPCWQDNPEKFKPDAIRRAQHVAYGITAAGKLLVCFFHDATLKMMADWFIEKGCVSACKSDGGHAAFLEFDGRRLGNQGVVACAFCLKLKVKK